MITLTFLARSPFDNPRIVESRVLVWELYLNILEIVRLFPNDKRAIERYSGQSLLGFTKLRGER